MTVYVPPYIAWLATQVPFGRAVRHVGSEETYASVIAIPDSAIIRARRRFSSADASDVAVDALLRKQLPRMTAIAIAIRTSGSTRPRRCGRRTRGCRVM